MLLPALSKARAKARAITCVNNFKHDMLFVNMYTNDNDDFFPSNYNDNAWFKFLIYSGYIQDDKKRPGLRCPANANNDSVSAELQDWKNDYVCYGTYETSQYNGSAWSGKHLMVRAWLDTVGAMYGNYVKNHGGGEPSTTPYLLESVSSSNTDYFSWYAERVHFYHNEMTNLGFVDGHVESWSDTKFHDFMYWVTMVY